MTKIDWYDFTGWQMENDQIQVVIVPTLGAKIASLVDKTANYEWLAPPTHAVRTRSYGDVFTNHDLSGWDEMLPTIDACASPIDPDVQLPDHGEVWALAWVVRQDNDALVTQVEGHKLDYRFTRTAILKDQGLRLEYTLENRSDQSMPFLWAAHPLFKADHDTVIDLPARITQVVNVAEHPVLGAAGGRYDWPLAVLPDGQSKRLDKIGSQELRDYRKFYVPPDQTVSSAGLRQVNIQRELRLTWDHETAPYLGIWIDEGTYTRSSTVALEPATGYYDSLVRAQENDRVSTVPAGGQVNWWLEVQLTAF